MSYTKEQRDSNALLDTMRQQFTKASDACASLYDQARDDIKFVSVPGNQWDPKLKERRKNRPCYEFPKLRMHLLQVINEMRQTRPQGKVRGVEEADQSLAEIMQGLCRNIESTSNAERAYDIAFESAVQGGVGYWRLCTDYLNDDDLEQDIRVKAIRNFACVKFDPAAVEIDRRDARYCFVEELIPRSQFEADYGEDKLKDFDLDSRCQADWAEKDQIRVAEYWYKKPITRELWVVRSQNGDSVVNADELGVSEDDLAAAGLQIVTRRTVKTHKVCMRLTNGHDWLTDEYEFPSKYIPIVPVWGNIQNIDGEDYWCGMTRFAKDQQRLHNVHRSALIEAVAKSPKAPFIAKPSTLGPHKKQWDNANAEDYPVLYIDDKAPPGEIPQRVQQAEVPVALIQLAGMDTDDMKAATGQYDASLGARSNETSGIAINSRKQQGATATFNYIDNLTYAIQYTYEILIDMIPRVYDTPRAVRVLGEDGGAKFHQLYQEVEDPTAPNGVRVLNDIRKGKYDVTVTVGPAYATQRMEAVEAFTQAASQIGSTNPALAALMAYQVVKNLDVPGSEETSKGFRKILVGQGLLEPQEGEQPPAPPPPNPKDVAEAKYKDAQTEKAEAETTALHLDNLARGSAQVFGPPPSPYGPSAPPGAPAQPQQPPQGGFFSPDGQPPGQQFTGP